MTLKPHFTRALVCGFMISLLPGYSKAQEIKFTDNLLDMDLLELMNVPIVIASKKSEGSFTAPLSTTVLSREEIEKSGVTSIEEAFKLVPGMIVREKSNGNFDVHIRGNDNVPPQNYTFYSENTTTLIMVNGRKVFNYTNGGVFWESLPISLNDIERIEIIRGPSTAMYGPNAMSGVINIVTSMPKDQTISATGSAQLGTEKTGIYNFAIGSSLLNDKLKLRVGANYDKRDRSSTDYYSWFKGTYVPREQLVGYSGNPITAYAAQYENPELSKERKGIVAAIGYDFSENISGNIEAGYQQSVAQTIFMESQVTPFTNRENNSKFINITGKVHGLELNFANTNGYQDIYVGNSAAEVDYNIMDATIEYNLELGNLSLRPGVSYQKATYSDLDHAGANGGGYINASRSLNTAAYYLRSDYKITQKLRLIGALRVDNYNMPDKSYISYQATATYSINDKNFIRASYGKANKGPVMVDYYADYRATGISYKGNPTLNLMSNNTVELGYRWMALKNLSFDAECYYSQTTDFTAFVPISVGLAQGGVQATYENLSLKSNILGGSLSINYILNSKYQAKLWAGYSNAQLKDVEQKTSPLIPPSLSPLSNGSLPTYQTTNMQNPQTPKMYGGASITAEPISKLTANLDCYYLSNYEYIHDFDVYAKAYSANPAFKGSGRTDVAARFTLNLKVGYDIYKKNQIFINCRNLLNTKAQEFGFADPIGGVYLVGLKLDL